MTFYVLFFLLVQFICLLGFVLKSKDRNKAIVCCLILMILFSGLNYGKGTDYISYRNIYNDNLYSESFQDIGFYSIVNILNWLELDFNIFIFIIALFNGFLLYIIIKKLNYKILFLSCYIAGFYLYFQFNALKQGLSVLMFIVAILYSSRIIKLIFISLSISMHSSQIITLLINYTNLKRFLLIFGLLIPLVYFVDKYYSSYIYLNILEQEKSLYPILIAKSLFCIWIIKFNVKKYWIYIYLILVVLIHFGFIYFSRYADVIFLILLCEFFKVDQKFKKIDYFLILIFISIMQIGTLNIVLKDCILNKDIWCNYNLLN